MISGTKFQNHLWNTFFRICMYHIQDPVYSPGSKHCGEPEIWISICGISLIRLVEKWLRISVLSDTV